MPRATKTSPVPGADLPVIDEQLPAPEETVPIPDRDLTAEAAAIFAGMGVDDPVVDTATAKRPVIAKLAQIMSSLPTLEPKGRNTHFGYDFIKDTQVSGAVRPRMARLGLMLIPDVVEESWVETRTSKGGISYVTKLKVNFTVVDAESGDSISGHGFGYGDDAGDKGANKALTAAEKYYLMKLFQIGGEDNESDDRADKRASEREAGAIQSVDQVNVAGKQIDGVAKGGMSDGVSSAQLSAIGATVQRLGWTPAIFITFIDEALGDALEVPDGQEAGPIIKAYLRALTGDDAGKLLTALMDAKDKAEGVSDEMPEAGEEPGVGYGG